jgi:hypothetical protein
LPKLFLTVLQKLILAFVLLSLFSSCAVVSKARYGNGFSIHFENNWLGKKEVRKDKKIEKKEFQDSVTLTRSNKIKASPLEIQISLSKTSQAPKIKADKTADIVHFENKVVANINSKKLRHLEKKSIVKTPLNKNLKNVSNQLEPNAGVAIFFYLAAIALGIIVSLSIFTNPLLPYFVILFIILSLIFAIISLVRINRSPYEFSGRKIDVFIIVTISLLILTMLLLLWIIYIIFGQ